MSTVTCTDSHRPDGLAYPALAPRLWSVPPNPDGLATEALRTYPTTKHAHSLAHHHRHGGPKLEQRPPRARRVAIEKPGYGTCHTDSVSFSLFLCLGAELGGEDRVL